VFGQQLIISALAKRTGKCVFTNLKGNKSQWYRVIFDARTAVWPSFLVARTAFSVKGKA